MEKQTSMFLLKIYNQDNQYILVKQCSQKHVLMQIIGSSDKSLNKCISHYTYIDLELPVFHIDYFRTLLTFFKVFVKYINI
ncbi:hypothetical protein HZH68_002973 [Vespula germanica]|uniref:Uncharacterized protein n=1 Tax=Vespula germanica TaxID=30212 RepID=A0A834NNA0_VESGE|nr:hypothetical protein HZH68_002973 [Vespula germanica]